jgi:hypothetical protein
MMYALDIHGAERGADGRINWWGPPPVSFMGIDEGDNTELVVSGESEVAVNGKRVPVAGLMGETSYGSNVNVIGC